MNATATTGGSPGGGVVRAVGKQGCFPPERPRDGLERPGRHFHLGSRRPRSVQTFMNDGYVSTTVQSDERAIIALADDTHERRIAHVHAIDGRIAEVRHGEADGVDAHTLVSFVVEAVELVHLVDDTLDGAAGEVV